MKMLLVVVAMMATVASLEAKDDDRSELLPHVGLVSDEQLTKEVLLRSKLFRSWFDEYLIVDVAKCIVVDHLAGDDVRIDPDLEKLLLDIAARQKADLAMIGHKVIEAYDNWKGFPRKDRMTDFDEQVLPDGLHKLVVERVAQAKKTNEILRKLVRVHCPDRLEELDEYSADVRGVKGK